MRVFVCVCLCVYMFVCVCADLRSVSMSVSMYAYFYVFSRVCLHICKGAPLLCADIRMRTHTHLCTCVCVHTSACVPFNSTYSTRVYTGVYVWHVIVHKSKCVKMCDTHIPMCHTHIPMCDTYIPICDTHIPICDTHIPRDTPTYTAYCIQSVNSSTRFSNVNRCSSFPSFLHKRLRKEIQISWQEPRIPPRMPPGSVVRKVCGRCSISQTRAHVWEERKIHTLQRRSN